MKVLGRDRLESFCRRHVDARRWIDNWLADVESAAWASPHDIRERYATVSLLGGGLVIFNVKGNAYRLEARIAYRTGAVSVEWIGTHAEHDERNRRR